jgi:carboxylate-amine ligase
MTEAGAWAVWQGSQRYTVGIEEETMLLDPADWSLAQRADDVLQGLPAELSRRFSAETHRGAIELATEPHDAVEPAVADVRRLRQAIAGELQEVGLRVACAGTHPFAHWPDTEISSGRRYQEVYVAMRELARREPTFAVHVHVGVDEPEAAIALLDRLRAHVPMLLALSANSPFWQGRDTGLASARTPLFQAFPRVGVPRAFGSYGAYVAAVDLLIRSGAIAEPTQLWWDVRPQPALGTVEVRVMDAQTRLADTAALAALVQAISRLELERGYASEALLASPEALIENRFLAARDGIDAELIDPERECRVPARELLAELMEELRPHAEALGSVRRLEDVSRLAREPGAARQRDCVAGDESLRELVSRLSESFLD